MREWAKTLKRVEQRYGVPGHILLAIWGRETGFGRAKLSYSAVRVLATKAFMSTRKDLFRKEILAALRIIQRGDVGAKSMKSSWAGAMGQPQFLPSSYLDFAVDFDGDGRANIWTSVPDTLASIANYLAKHGWQRGRDWGFEVRIPDIVSCAQEGPDRAQPIRKWVAKGHRTHFWQGLSEARGESCRHDVGSGRAHRPAFHRHTKLLCLEEIQQFRPLRPVCRKPR